MDNPGSTIGMVNMGQTDLRLLFDAPLREHATLSVDALKATLLHTPDAEALRDALDENSTAVAEAIEAGYPGTHDDFLELWRAHTGYYKQYADATLQADESTKEAAKDKLDNFAEETASLLADASPILDTDDIQEALSTHADCITTIIDDLADEEFDDAFAALHEAYEHMGTVADLLSRHVSAKQVGGVRA